MPKILIAENDADVLRAYEAYLKSLEKRIGRNVEIESANGKSLLEIFKPSEYDIIIMDRRLGRGVSGIKLAKEIRSLDSKVPIYMFGSGINRSKSAKKAGVTRYFDKADFFGIAFTNIASYLREVRNI